MRKEFPAKAIICFLIIALLVSCNYGRTEECSYDETKDIVCTETRTENTVIRTRATF